jgi:hypothetical protein
MTKAHRRDEEGAPLRPVGIALAAVVAGLGAGASASEEASPKAPLVPSHDKTFYFDPTNHPSFEEDPDFIVESSEPIEPLRGQQQDLFKR